MKQRVTRAALVAALALRIAITQSTRDDLERRREATRDELDADTLHSAVVSCDDQIAAYKTVAREFEIESAVIQVAAERLTFLRSELAKIDSKESEGPHVVSRRIL